jgi:hypothetical protein
MSLPATRVVCTVLGGGMLLLCAGGCANWALSLPARGEIGGQTLAANVDSEAARYYLQEYLPGRRRVPQLDAAFARLSEDNEHPTREQLRSLSQTYSTDFATLYLAQALARDPDNRRLRAVFERERAAVTAALARGESPALPAFADYVLVFVPAWNHKNSRLFANADFASPRAMLARHGLATQLVETDPNGPVEANAEIVAAAIRAHAAGKAVILVSASMGSAAAAAALGERLRAAETCPVRAWLNIAGLLQGTVLADRAGSGPRLWFRRAIEFVLGWDADAVDSMGTARSRARFARLHLPAHVQVLNYVGIPVSGTVSEPMQPHYLGLRDEGPNDGLVLIADALAAGGPTLFALGRDHLLADDPGIDVTSLALVRTLLAELPHPPRPCAAIAAAR